MPLLIYSVCECMQESPLQDLAKLFQDCRHQWFLTQVDIPQGRRARATATLAFFYNRIYSAFEYYTFWEALPLFDFFCLARILPYMTLTKEKQCILNGLQRISDTFKL